MNTSSSRSIRPLLWSVFTVFALGTGTVQAGPPDFGPSALRHVTPAGPQTCGKVWKPATYGPGTGPKAIYVADRDLGSCPRSTGEPITGYVGPRNAVPVRQ
jgi:hypothetical protein